MSYEDTPIIREKFKDLIALLHKYETERIKSNQNITNINKIHDRVQNEKKLPSVYKKLKQLCSSALQDTQIEESTLKEALDIVTFIQNERRKHLRNDDPHQSSHQETLMELIQHCGQSLPLFIGKPGDTPPPLCGAIPADSNYVAKAHDMVAARIGNKGEEMWILAEVSDYNAVTCKYLVNDIDGEKKDKHTLGKKDVIPLPLFRANPEKNPKALFPADKSVLALYPQATCFYPAIVKEAPMKPDADYQLLFEDSNIPGGIDPTPINVCQKYVILLPGKT